MLQLLHCTSAPSWTNVSINTAVSIVMCRQPAIRAPESGLLAPYFVRSAIKPGISFSASMISRRPQSASEMSFTLYGSFLVTACATTISSQKYRHRPPTRCSDAGPPCTGRDPLGSRAGDANSPWDATQYHKSQTTDSTTRSGLHGPTSNGRFLSRPGDRPVERAAAPGTPQGLPNASQASRAARTN